MAGTEAKQRALEAIVQEARDCTRCPSMHGRSRVLGPSNGDADARCLVVAEAPGHFGSNETGVPLRGDRTGDTFERLLRDAGIDRADLFITNAVLCAARTKTGRGRKPRKREIKTCAHFLGSLLEVLDPKLVVTLGSTALAGLDAVASHEISLKRDVGTPTRWHGRWLFPLYHPGARAMIHRPLAAQKRDFQTLRSFLYP